VPGLIDSAPLYLGMGSSALVNHFVFCSSLLYWHHCLDYLCGRIFGSDSIGIVNLKRYLGGIFHTKKLGAL